MSQNHEFSLKKLLILHRFDDLYLKLSSESPDIFSNSHYVVRLFQY